MALIPIGRFAKMTRLSVKALRLYDEKDLLRPAHVDPSSAYRYYRVDQAYAAEAIRILRSIDMPLDEIRAILVADDHTQAEKPLLVHRERLARRLAAQQRMLTYLETIIQHKELIVSYDVEIAEQAPQNVAAVKIHTSLARIANDVQSGFATLMQGLGRADVSPSGPPLMVFHDTIDETTDGDIEICAPVGNGFSGDSNVYGRELEGGTMATTVHRGPYEQITPAYHTLMSWISENGYEIAGPPREIYLNDPRTVPPEELLTRLEFPICSEHG